jgi:hypothetical protein
MRVEVDKTHKASYTKLAAEINKYAKRFKPGNYKIAKGYGGILLDKDVSVEKKKKDLTERLHELVVRTFSIDLNKLYSKRVALNTLKGNIKVLREFVNKLRDINYYLEENFLAELGLIKRSLRLYKHKNPEKLIERASFSLDKKYLNKLEHTTYKLIEKVIIFDKQLLNGYKSKGKEVVTEEGVWVKDINKILKRQSELLAHMEAKLPPPSKVKPLLLTKNIFSQWASTLLALLAAFESECKKERAVFQQLKKNGRARRIINKKIKSLEKEKADLIKIKQERAMDMTVFGSLDDELRLMFHEFNAIKNL